MSDVETQVYSWVSGHAKAAFPTLTCSSYMSATPDSYPYALIEQTDQYDVRRTLNSRHQHEAVHVTFEANVFSDAQPGRKAQAKAVMSSIAESFRALGFTCTAGGQPIDLTDPKSRRVIRLFSRFEADVADDAAHTY